MPYSPMGAQPLGFAPWQPFGVYLWQAYVQPGDGHRSTPGMHRVAAPTATLGRVKPSATHSAVPQPIGGVYSLGGSIESHQIPPPSLHAGEGSSFPGLVQSDDVVNPDSVMAVKPGDSGVVIGYQVDEFTHTWSTEQFVARSHIYPGFTGKVSSLTHFPLEPGCEDYAFLDQAVADFEQGLDSILTDSLETLDLDTSLQESDAITSSVSSGFLHSVSTISDNSKPQLAPSIRTHKLWCQARALLTPVSLATKMSASKLIRYFSSHPAAFGFRASTPPDNISLNSANRKVDQSLSDFQTGLGATAHATLDTEQLISHLQVALVDTLSSLPEAEGDVIPVSEVHELLLQIHGILDKAVSKRVGNSAHILAHLFNSVSRQRREVWASQFPFLHSLKEVVPPSEACLYGRINWSLAQAHSVGLSPSFPPKRGGKARPWTGFQFTVQKRPVSGSVPGTSGAPLPKQPHLESVNEARPHGKKSAGGAVSTSSTESRPKGGCGRQHA